MSLRSCLSGLQHVLGRPYSRSQRRSTYRPRLEVLEGREVPTAMPGSPIIPAAAPPAIVDDDGAGIELQPVLMVIANQDFYYQEYGDTRQSLEAAGLRVEVAATTRTLSRPHFNSGQGADGGLVMPDLALADVNPDRYSAIVFVGGWGSSAYQYGFAGTYANSAYNGDSGTRTVVNQLIGTFAAQDKYVAALCHGVTVLAWARVDGSSPLGGRSVAGYGGSAPVSNVSGSTTSRWHVENNGATMFASRSLGNPFTATDDVHVDGRIITAENFDSVRRFGEVIAGLVLEETVSPVTVTITATDADAAEAGQDAAVFTVTRDGGNLNQPLTVPYRIDGCAINGTDYTALTGTVIIPAGATTATITLTPVDDLRKECNETVILTLSENPAYQLGTSTRAEAAIRDNDCGIIVTGAAACCGPHVKACSGGGVRVAAVDAVGDCHMDIVAGAGPGCGRPVRVLDAMRLAEMDAFFAYGPCMPNGLFVG